MSTLNITRSLVSATNPTEDQFDTIRDELLAYFNGTELEATNIADGGMLYTSLTLAADDDPLLWEDSDSRLEYVSATNNFLIRCNTGEIVFQNKIGTTSAESLRMETTGALTIGAGGIPKIGQGNSSTAMDLVHALARYRKPRLEYTDDDIITIENNTGTSGQTVLFQRDQVTAVVDRTLSLAVEANGYAGAHTGAAVSGRKVALARATNTWYYIYGVQVQGGDDIGGNSIMVADTTSPVQANCAGLDTAYGAGKWVYLGIIRNGYNDGTNTNIIVPFQYDEYGELRFTKTTSQASDGMGIVLASATASTDLDYAMAFGTGAAEIPVVALRGTLMGYRSGYGFEMYYIDDSTAEVHALNTNYQHTSGESQLTATAVLDIPFMNSYTIRLKIGSTSTTNKIRLAALVDHYV